MSVPADVIPTSPGHSSLDNLSLFALELLEAAGLGLLVAGGALLLGRIGPDQIPRYIISFVVGYLLL